MSRSIGRVLTLALALLLSTTTLLIPSASAQSGTVTLEWLGHNAWRVTSPGGKVIFMNPFLNNPDQILRVDDVTQADLILVTDGHGDELGQTVPIAQNTGSRTISSFGLGTYLIASGVPMGQVVRVDPGGRVRADGIVIRVLNGVHGSNITGSTPTNTSGGVANSYMITFENGWTLYYGGSGAATQDMALWARLYRPDAAIIYMGADKEPMDYALSVSLLMTDNPNLRTIFPGHHRFQQPAGATTIAEVDAALSAMGISLSITEPAPGQPFEFTQ